MDNLKTETAGALAGLSAGEAAARLAQYGPNEVREANRNRFWRCSKSSGRRCRGC